MKQILTVLFLITTILFVSCAEEEKKEIKNNNKNGCIFGIKDGDTCKANKDAIHDLGITTGTFPNEILIHNNSLFIINSGDNAIQKIDLNDNTTNHNPFISLPEGSNPYYMTIDDNNELFVTNLMTNSYSRVLLNNEANVKTFNFENENSLKGPEGIAVNNNNIFITNTNSSWDNSSNSMIYNNGFITMIKKSDNSFIKKISTNQKNPQRAFIENNKLYIINSGIVKFDENYIGYPKSNAGIDVLDLTNTNAGFINTEIPFTDGKLHGFPSPYTLSNDRKILYLASGTAPELYAYDIVNNSMIRNTNNPIIVDTFNTPTSVMLNFTIVNQYLFIVNFNNDMLYILDTSDNYKLVLKTDIGEDSNSMEGAQGIVYNKKDNKVYIFFGISKRLISIDIDNL